MYSKEYGVESLVIDTNSGGIGNSLEYLHITLESFLSDTSDTNTVIAGSVMVNIYE